MILIKTSCEVRSLSRLGFLRASSIGGAGGEQGKGQFRSEGQSWLLGQQFRTGALAESLCSSAQKRYFKR